MSVKVIQADYHNPQHARHVIELLDCYATDPMGGGMALSDYTAQNLIPTLADRSDAFSILAYVDGQPAGLTNCFEGFSTFACQPLINIHDVVLLIGAEKELEKQPEWDVPTPPLRRLMNALDLNPISWMTNTVRPCSGKNPYPHEIRCHLSINSVLTARLSN